MEFGGVGAGIGVVVVYCGSVVSCKCYKFFVSGMSELVFGMQQALGLKHLDCLRDVCLAVHVTWSVIDSTHVEMFVKL